MLRLLAYHDDRQLDRLFLLADNEPHVLGRAEASDFCTDWDSQISRSHVRLQPEGETVRLTRLDTSSNPVFVDGADVTSTELPPSSR